MPKWTNNANLPGPICKIIEKQYHAHSLEGADISVTSLIDSPLRFWLRRHKEDQLTIDYADRIWVLFGSMVHHYCADPSIGTEAKAVEATVIAEIEGLKVKGTFDLLDESGYLTDYKATSTYTVDDGPRDEWVQQLNCYLHLMRLAPCYDVSGIKGLRVCAILRDWGPRLADRSPVPVKVLDIPMWTHEQAADLVRNKVMLHKAAMENKPHPPAVCLDEERWAKPPSFAVMKRGRKSAVRVLPTREAAEQWMSTQGRGDYIEERAGSYPRCEQYCDWSKCGLCPHYQIG